MGVVDPIGPRSQYIEGKRFGEALVTAYHRHFELDVRIARIFNTYGPRMKLTDTRLVVDFVRRALKNEALSVYGGADALGAYCYVGDMVKGLVRLMGQEGAVAPVNLGQDTPVKLAELAAQVVALTNSSSRVEVSAGWPTGYHRQLIANIARAKEELGWFPVVLLPDGLKHTIDYLTAAVDLIEAGGELPAPSAGADELDDARR
jgi:UDP-glucuronate decarboxylase